MLTFIVEDQANSTLAHLGGKLVRRLAHDAPSYSGVGASGKPGAVHIKRGAINEPNGKPDPQVALPSAVNWMRALRSPIEDAATDFATAGAFHADQERRRMGNLVENAVLEQVLSALEPFRSGATTADFARVGLLGLVRRTDTGRTLPHASQSGSPAQS